MMLFRISASFFVLCGVDRNDHGRAPRGPQHGKIVGLMRADSGFFGETILTTLEGKDILYIIAAPDSTVTTDYLSGHRLMSSVDRTGTNRVP